MAKHHKDGHHGHHGHHHMASGGHLYEGHDGGPTEHDHLKHGGHAGHHGHKGHHHKHRKDGGRTEMKVSGNPDVFKEAHDKHGTAMKHGGKAKHHGKHHHAHHGKHHKATGGAVQVGLMTGGAVRPRLDKPGRKKGGRVGADHSPLSSAHHGHGDGHETPNSRDTYGGTPP